MLIMVYRPTNKLDKKNKPPEEVVGHPISLNFQFDKEICKPKLQFNFTAVNKSTKSTCLNTQLDINPAL